MPSPCFPSLMSCHPTRDESMIASVGNMNSNCGPVSDHNVKITPLEYASNLRLPCGPAVNCQSCAAHGFGDTTHNTTRVAASQCMGSGTRCMIINALPPRSASSRLTCSSLLLWLPPSLASASFLHVNCVGSQCQGTPIIFSPTHVLRRGIVPRLFLLKALVTQLSILSMLIVYAHHVKRPRG